MNNQGFEDDNVILVLGATGFIGRRLIPKLRAKGIQVRMLVRDPDKTADLVNSDRGVTAIMGNLLTGAGISEALKGIRTAYYLVHSMGGRNIFKNRNTLIRTEKRLKLLSGQLILAGLKESSISVRLARRVKNSRSTLG